MSSGHHIFASPLYFQSPEMLESFKFSEKHDVWATGIILSMLLSG
jgi:serine/threonine protein kinase